MSVTITPPYVLQGASHSALLFRQAISTLIGPAGGVVHPGDLSVSPNGTPNMSVNVAGGAVWVPGSFGQALYYARADATMNLAVNAADPTNPRIDTVVVQIRDAAYSGVNNDAILDVVAGTPTAGATLTNLNGAGALPSNALILGYVLVPNSATSIVSGDIVNVASGALLGLGGTSVPIAASESTSSNSFTTLATPDQVANIVLPSNGLIAVWYQATWQESVSGAARAAIFIGNNQLKVPLSSGGAPVTQAAATNTGTAATNYLLFAASVGLLSQGGPATAYGGAVGTGQAAGVLNVTNVNNIGMDYGGVVGAFGVLNTMVGGPCVIESLPAGTYTVSVRFKASSGSVTASFRSLCVAVLPFG